MVRFKYKLILYVTVKYSIILQIYFQGIARCVSLV